MRRLKPVDVVIAGGGWTGLLMAKEIATRSSVSVVVLERGPRRGIAAYSTGMDELDYNVRYRMMQNIAEETITHRHSVRDTAVPVRQYGSFNPGTGTGGAGEHWGALSYRFRPHQFTLATYLRGKHGARLPENIAIQDWGITYDELEPYYWRAEHMMGVGGKAGNLRGVLVEGGNIFRRCLSSASASFRCCSRAFDIRFLFSGSYFGVRTRAFRCFSLTIRGFPLEEGKDRG
jgi:gluconate 2-dehydrogenase alpha chain